MAKGKLRAVAKKVRGDKWFKTQVSDFLVDIIIGSQSYNLKEILSTGHRGFLAMSEDDLCDEFDRVVVELQERKIIFKRPQDGWNWTEPTDKFIARADQIYTEIFERTILRGNKPSGRRADEKAIRSDLEEDWSGFPPR